jgi:predicted ester cyclase
MMEDQRVRVARRLMETYVAGDADGLLDCLADDWVMHDADGRTSGASELADITRLHNTAFPDIRVEFLHEVAKDDSVAHHVLFIGTHSGRYFDLEPTEKPVRLEEMIFHRIEGGSIAESWRLTYPGSMYDQLVEPDG